MRSHAGILVVDGGWDRSWGCHRTLSSLSLNLSHCQGPNQGLGEGTALLLAERVPEGLRSFYFNFAGCELGESGAPALAERLPAKLRRRISFDYSYKRTIYIP